MLFNYQDGHCASSAMTFLIVDQPTFPRQGPGASSVLPTGLSGCRRLVFGREADLNGFENGRRGRPARRGNVKDHVAMGQS